MSDLFTGLRPSTPPPELRGRVLAAAREAARDRRPDLLEMLLADRAVRVSVAAVALLLLAQAVVNRPADLPRPLPPSPLADEASVPTEAGLTAAEQIHDLEPAL